jgi:hypothetical protein
VDLNSEDLRMDVFTNTAETHVRITHERTGVIGVGHDPENPHGRLAAERIALRDLADKLGIEGTPTGPFKPMAAFFTDLLATTDNDLQLLSGHAEWRLEFESATGKAPDGKAIATGDEWTRRLDDGRVEHTVPSSLMKTEADVRMLAGRAGERGGENIRASKRNVTAMTVYGQWQGVELAP